MTPADLETNTDAASTAEAETVTVLLYSDNAEVRAAVRRAIGKRPAKDAPTVRWEEFATQPALQYRTDEGGFDLAILDGEAAKAGGMGVCRQMKNEIDDCPPILVLIGRDQDAWLASWSTADAVVSHPLDSRVLAETVAALLADRSR